MRYRELASSRGFIAALTFGVGIGLAGAAAAEDLPARIKIGLLTAITGPAAQSGATTKPVIQMAIKEINDAGGLAGRPVDLAIGDTATDPTQTVSEAKRLIQQEKIMIVMGPEIGPFAMAAAPVLTEAKLLSFPVTGAATITAQSYPYGFGAYYPATAFTISVVEYAAKILKVKNVAVMTDTGAQGMSTHDTFKTEIPAHGMTMTGIQTAESKTPDYTSQLLSLRRGNPEAILFITSLGDDVGTVYKNTEELGWKIPVVNQTAAYTVKATLNTGGPDVFKSGRIHNQTLKSTTFCPGDPVGGSAYAKFLTRLKDFTGNDFANINQVAAVLSYDSMLTTKAAVEATKAVDGPTLAKWIESNSASIKSAGGPISASPAQHFIYGPDVFAYTLRPDDRREDLLVPRTGC
jgi:ABC-type branched-subunit amino acid transport system substrate-binding protein